jgi:hypothetical protein
MQDVLRDERLLVVGRQTAAGGRGSRFHSAVSSVLGVSSRPGQCRKITANVHCSQRHKPYTFSMTDLKENRSWLPQPKTN